MIGASRNKSVEEMALFAGVDGVKRDCAPDREIAWSSGDVNAFVTIMDVRRSHIMMPLLISNSTGDDFNFSRRKSRRIIVQFYLYCVYDDVSQCVIITIVNI